MLVRCQNKGDNQLYNGQIAKQAVSWSGAVISETVSNEQVSNSCDPLRNVIKDAVQVKQRQVRSVDICNIHI